MAVFKISDVVKYKKGLNDDQAAYWLAIANRTVQEKLDDGTPDFEAEMIAVRKANAMFSESLALSDDALKRDNAFVDGGIKLAVGAAVADDTAYQMVLPMGLTHSNYYGELIFTPAYMQRLIANQGALKNTKPFLDKDHTRGEAYGWVEDMKADDDGLKIKWKFTELGVEAISKEIYKYYSVHLGSLKDRDTGDIVYPVFMGCALTNNPVMKQMPAAHLSEPGPAQRDREIQSMEVGTMRTFEEVMAALLLLDGNELAKATDAQRMQVASKLNIRLAEPGVDETAKVLEQRVKTLSEENAELRKKQRAEEIKTTLDESTSKGKIKPVERQEYEKNLNEDFDLWSKVLAKLPENSAVNLSELGTGDVVEGELSLEEKAMLDGLGIVESDYKKYGGV